MFIESREMRWSFMDRLHSRKFWDHLRSLTVFLRTKRRGLPVCPMRYCVGGRLNLSQDTVPQRSTSYDRMVSQVVFNPRKQLVLVAEPEDWEDTTRQEPAYSLLMLTVCPVCQDCPRSQGTSGGKSQQGSYPEWSFGSWLDITPLRLEFGNWLYHFN
jgi:hypothetical protein